MWRVFIAISASAVLLFASPLVRADDWPQWLGPQRDGIWRESGLLEKFPADGLKVQWRVPIGGGYAGPAVAGGRVYVTDFMPRDNAHRPADPFQRITQPGDEHIVCLDQRTGQVLWTHAYPVAYSMSYSAGPRTTPVVEEGHVYCVGGEGDLVCLDAMTGKLAWAKHFSDEKSPTPLWGFAAAPLIDGDSLICLTGGSDPAHGRGVVTAFNKQTGEMIWTALASKEPGYAPPVICQAGGVRQLIVWDPDAVYGLDPRNGKVYWSVPFTPIRMGVSVVTPTILHDKQLGTVLFVSTQNEGSLVLKLDDEKPAARILWKRAGKNDRKTDALHILMARPSIREGHIYGVDAYGDLRCLDLKTGDRLWATSAATTYDAGPQKWSTAFLIELGDNSRRYLIANEHGDLILADLDPAGYHQISRAHVLDPTNMDAGRPVLWSHPACAGRCIFWRNDKEVVCVSLASPAAN